jgi:hypothetical protein
MTGVCVQIKARGQRDPSVGSDDDVDEESSAVKIPLMHSVTAMLCQYSSSKCKNFAGNVHATSSSLGEWGVADEMAAKRQQLGLRAADPKELERMAAPGVFIPSLVYMDPRLTTEGLSSRPRTFEVLQGFSRICRCLRKVQRKLQLMTPPTQSLVDTL